MNQCFALPHEERETTCIGEVIHQDGERSSERQRAADAAAAAAAAHPPPLSSVQREICAKTRLGTGIHKLDPDNAECNDARRRHVEDVCATLWNMPDIIEEERGEPGCQAAMARGAAKAKADAAKWKAAAKAAEVRRRAAITALPISDAEKQDLRDKNLFIGATEAMARLAWGPPEHVNRTVTASMVHEQWIYGDQYLYFDNGILTAIQSAQ